MCYFFPSKIINYIPSDFDINYKEINIDLLNGWLIKNQLDKSQSKTLSKTLSKTSCKITSNTKLLIYFHGNAGNISNRIWIIKQLLEIFPETDIYIYDYPQFGLSSGSLNISNIILSGYKVYRYWSDKYSNITLLGESIGAGIIAEVYALLIKFKHKNMPKMIIHLNGITSLHKTINSIIPFIIKPFIIPWIYEFDCEKIYSNNITKIPKLLILHTPNDEIININLVFELLDKLAYSPNLHYIKIYGTHCQPIIDDQCIKKIRYIYNL